MEEKLRAARASNNALSSVYDKIAEVEENLKRTEHQYRTLNEEASNLNQGQPREAFTNRIEEIVKQIAKQQDGIDKIIEDVKSVQKDINLLNGRLERAFFDTDRIMKKNVGKKETSVSKSVGLLTEIHKECFNTVEAVRKTGALKRDIRELEDNIKLEKEKDLARKSEKLRKDLELLQSENKEITKMYRAKQKS